MLDADRLDATPTLRALVELGLHHEQQHQELLLMDIKHVLSCNPLRPASYARRRRRARAEPARCASSTSRGGIVEIGHDGDGFAFDNETPRHACYLEPYRIADRLVTRGEWLAFIADGGYHRPELWLSDGWARRAGAAAGRRRCTGATTATDGWTCSRSAGRRPSTRTSPSCHVSYYEADAFARWRGARLPTEVEWEHARRGARRRGALRDLGDVAWQWTASARTCRIRASSPRAGAVGEYNGKFMSNQMVLRGGARVTPAGHSRATYRNFFPPASRWAFSGARSRMTPSRAPDPEDRMTATLRSTSTAARPSPSRMAPMRAGLTATPKDIPPKWFYDDRG